MATTPPPPKTTATALGIADGRAKKLYPRQWLEIVNLAQSGVKIAELAHTYGVSGSVIYRGLRKRGINPAATASKLVIEEADRQRADLLRKIRETKDQDYLRTMVLQAQISQVANNVMRDGGRFASHLDDFKALKVAIDGIRSGTQNKWMILGLDKENDKADAVLPELPIRDLSDDEIEAMRTQQADEDGGIAESDELDETLAEVARELDAEVDDEVAED